MDSFQSQSVKLPRFQMPTEALKSHVPFTSLTKETSIKPVIYGIYTGEYREPLRERVHRMRNGRHALTPLRPDTPMPSKHTSSSSTKIPVTPSDLQSIPQCPRAPLKNKANELR
ncbi:hypothetical protein NUW58_g3744 [Xylaria curta]|uniref:Uncharacterized protein n=2 Tax=Xylaria curta TaxID=42375 RepID=A0ACC1PBI5_9PEZI|nr:hypothetical protein NUW58_g3902 [Xylaria curta]KAJ2988886.1 hypothetical protein NUW58_g3744 [Xylaria curta]